MKQNLKEISLQIASVLGFGVALAACIPPVPSDPSTKYTFFPFSALVALIPFAASRIIDTKVGVAWWQVVIQTSILALAGKLIFERALMK